MAAITAQTINDLKAAGHYAAAGALARTLGHPRQYGCHFGMRSSLDSSRDQFNRGYDAADQGAR